MALGLRVTFNALARHANSGMTTSLSRLAQAQETLTSGKRVNRLSDDPQAGAQILKLSDALADLSQYKRNGEQGSALLARGDSALASVGDLVREAKTVALQAVSSNTNASDPVANEALAQQIGRIKEQIVHLAQTDVNGRYIFSGQKTNTPPFDPADVTNTYNGDSGALRVETDRGQFIATNVPGDTVFGQLLTDLDTLRANILTPAGATKESVQAMDDGLNRVLSARSTLGSRLKQIEDTRTSLDAAEQELSTRLSGNQDADIAQTFVELQAAQNAYQAALASSARSFEHSLMDYLR